jgi:hypothetical protein
MITEDTMWLLGFKDVHSLFYAAKSEMDWVSDAEEAGTIFI